MIPLAFAFMIESPQDTGAAALLAESIRAWGGNLAGGPVWALAPDGMAPLPARALARLARADVELVSFAEDAAVADLPYSGKVLASAQAEAKAVGTADVLAWVDVGSLVFREPTPLVLPPEVSLGYRPVDLALIGSPTDAPPDPFWQAIYRELGASIDSAFPMVTSVDRKRIRAYWNAGLLAVRPERRLLQHWAEALVRLTPSGKFDEWLSSNPRHQAFFHQAVLAGVILAHLRGSELAELPHLISYPLHLHTRYPAEQRPLRLNDLITCRAEEFFSTPDWPSLIPVDPPLRGWLESHLNPRTGAAI